MYDSSIDGVVIRNMILKNAGKECLRFRYYVTNSVVTENDILNCGVTDFQIQEDGENGEGVCECPSGPFRSDFAHESEDVEFGGTPLPMQ